MVESVQLWQQIELNRTGVRRVKLVDSGSLSVPCIPPVLPVPVGLVIMYEFVFPDKVGCGAWISKAVSEGGSPYWKQSLKFSLPHLWLPVLDWLNDHAQTRWIAICEDYNGNCFLLGLEGSLGLTLQNESTTGASLGDRNTMAFSLESNQIRPMISLPAYDDSILFPDGSFSYGFSLAFN